jgi:hypothetical protein
MTKRTHKTISQTNLKILKTKAAAMIETFSNEDVSVSVSGKVEGVDRSIEMNWTQFATNE